MHHHGDLELLKVAGKRLLKKNNIIPNGGFMVAYHGRK